MQIHLEPIIGDKGQQLPCRFYDVPGIEQKKTLTDEELRDLQEIIDGKMILDVDVSGSKITLTFKRYKSKNKHEGLQTDPGSILQMAV